MRSKIRVPSQPQSGLNVQSSCPLWVIRVDLAGAQHPVQDGRIHIELINGPMIFDHKATPAEYGAGLNLTIERGWLTLDRSGTYVKFTQAGTELFA